MLRKDLSEIKLSFSSRLVEVEKENTVLSTSLRSTQKLSEMQMNENKKLIAKKTEGSKENRVLKKELKLLEEEHAKVLEKNRDLKQKVEWFEKIVYGNKTKPKK